MSRYDYLLQHFASSADLTVRPDGRNTSRSQFLDNSLRLLNFLVAQGARRGDRIVIALDNRPEYLELMLALALGGMTACPVPPDTVPAQMSKVRKLVDAKLTLTSYSQLAYALDNSLPDCIREGDEDDPFLVVFSSGTTGAPKGIVQSLRNFFESACSFTRLSGLVAGDVVLHNWPMFYNAGLFNLFACPLVGGASIAVGRRFSAKDMGQFWSDVETFHPDLIYLSPTMAASLTRTFKFFGRSPDVLGKARIVSTSSILYPSIKDEFRRLFGKGIIPCFGITELGGSFTFGDEDSAPYSVGRTIPEAQIEIDAAADGEVLVRTPYIALGYLGEHGRIDAFDRDAVFRTGDLGNLRGNELIISGRRKDSIKKGGEFINLSEIEDLANASGLCQECMAIGRPDTFWGEVYDIRFVAIEGRNEHEVASALTALFNSNLPQIQRPESVKPVAALPKTASGKVIKQAVRYE